MAGIKPDYEEHDTHASIPQIMKFVATMIGIPETAHIAPPHFNNSYNIHRYMYAVGEWHDPAKNERTTQTATRAWKDHRAWLKRNHLPVPTGR